MLTFAPRSRRPWTPREDDTLALYWGLEPDAAVAARLGRTVCACDNRARLRRLGRRANVTSAAEVARVFGVDHATVRRWIRLGYLAATRAGYRTGAGYQGGPGYRARHVTTAALFAFVRNHRERYVLERMAPGHWLTEEARAVTAADPWLPLDAAARRLNYVPAVLARYLLRAGVPHIRVRGRSGTRGGPHQGRIYLREADLPALAARLAAAPPSTQAYRERLPGGAGNGRGGERHPMAKLSDRQVAEVRALWAARLAGRLRVTRTAVAARYGISPNYVTHLTDPLRAVKPADEGPAAASPAAHAVPVPRRAAPVGVPAAAPPAAAAGPSSLSALASWEQRA